MMSWTAQSGAEEGGGLLGSVGESVQGYGADGADGADSVTDGMLPSVDGCLGPCVVASFVYFPPPSNHFCSACRSSSQLQKTLPEL